MLEDLLTKFKEHENKVIILLAALVVLDFLVWWQVFNAEAAIRDLEIYFLDVGQGDSGLVVLPGGVEVLIDGGPPNGKVLDELGRILKWGDRYVDLVILSHPELDHFGGLVEVLNRYKVGALIWNGLEGKSAAFDDFKRAIYENNIQEIVLRAGDSIRHKDSNFFVLSPGENFSSIKEVNDTSLVLELKSKNSKVLFTGDISAAIEENLLVGDVDVLKVAHHGSKFSTSANFLSAAKPEAAIIGVGKNSYGHPTPQTLERLEDTGAQVFRTDSDGTVKFVIDGETIRVFKASSIK